MKTSRSLAGLGGLLLLFGLLVGQPLDAFARRPIDQVLTSRTPEEDGEFGTDVAVSDRWVVVGEPGKTPSPSSAPGMGDSSGN